MAPVFRRRRLVLLSFLSVFFSAAVTTFLWPKQYRAEMKLIVLRERADTPVTSERNAWFPLRSEVSEEELNSEVELLKSRDLLEKVAVACGLPESERESALSRAVSRITPSAARSGSTENGRVARAVRVLEKSLQVEPLKKTSLIRVSYESFDRHLAARVLSTLADLYLEKHVTVHRPPGAFDFFQGQTQRYQKELSDAETRLTDFTREGGVVAAPLQKEITLQRLGEFDATLHKTQSAEAETENRIRGLESQLATTPTRLTTQVRTSVNPTLLQQLKSTLLSLELRRTELLTKFVPDYRPVQEVEKEIAQTRAAIGEAEREPLREETTDRDPTHEWLRGELAKSRAEFAALRARETSIFQIVRTYQERAREIEQQGSVQHSLMRAAKAAEENYLLYLRKQEEARISDALDRQRIVNVAIAQAPNVPALPAGPRWWGTLFSGAALAVVLSLGLAFAADFLDPSFRTPDELREFLDVSVLAALPKVGR